MALPFRIAVLNPDPIVLDFIDAPDYPNGDTGTLPTGPGNFANFQQAGFQGASGMYPGLYIGAFNDGTHFNYGDLIGLSVYGFNYPDYLKYGVGTTVGGFRDLSYEGCVFTNNRVNITAFYAEQTIGNIFKAYYTHLDLPDGYTGGTVAGVLPVMTRHDLDFGAGTWAGYSAFYNLACPLPSTSDANPTTGLLTMMTFDPDPQNLNNVMLVIKQDNSGISLRSAFVIDDGQDEYSGVEVVANSFDGTYNYTWVQRGPYYNYTMYRWIDDDYGVPTLFEGWRLDFDDPYLQHVFFDFPGAYLPVYGTKFGFISCFVDPDTQDVLKALLIAPDWSSYQWIEMTSSDPKASAILAGPWLPTYETSPLLMLAPDGRYYLSDSTPSPVVNLATAIPGGPPPQTSGKPMVALVNSYRLPCFTPCIPHAIREI